MILVQYHTVKNINHNFSRSFKFQAVCRSISLLPLSFPGIGNNSPSNAVSSASAKTSPFLFFKSRCASTCSSLISAEPQCARLCGSAAAADTSLDAATQPVAVVGHHVPVNAQLHATGEVHR